MSIDDAIRQIEKWAGASLPADYISLLHNFGGQSIGALIMIYSPEDLVERNVTFEVKRYYPDHITIGDDSGGRAIMIPLSKSLHIPVSIVDHGSMDPDDFQFLGNDLSHWVRSGCPLS